MCRSWWLLGRACTCDHETQVSAKAGLQPAHGDSSIQPLPAGGWSGGQAVRWLSWRRLLPSLQRPGPCACQRSTLATKLVEAAGAWCLRESAGCPPLSVAAARGPKLPYTAGHPGCFAASTSPAAICRAGVDWLQSVRASFSSSQDTVAGSTQRAMRPGKHSTLPAGRCAQLSLVALAQLHPACLRWQSPLMERHPTRRRL